MSATYMTTPGDVTALTWRDLHPRKMPNGDWGVTEETLARVIEAPSTFAAWVIREVARELKQYREQTPDSIGEEQS